MGTLYVKAFDVMDVMDGTVNHMNESWDQQINQEKYEIIEDTDQSPTNESHVTLALEQVFTLLSIQLII